MAKNKRPKWPKKDCVYINIPLYGGSLFVFKSDKAYMQAYAALGLETDTEKFAGSCTHLENETNGAALYLLLIADGSLSTMVHEIGHACDQIVTRAGFNLSHANGEPFCYLLGDLFDKVRSGYKKKFKRSLK